MGKSRKRSIGSDADMIFVKSFTQAYTLRFRNLPEENAQIATLLVP